MKLRRLRLESIRQFRELDLSFVKQGGAPYEWTIILGDNGTGKTTLLRTLAIGLCDESSAAGLVRERKSGFVPRRSKEGTILIEVSDGDTWTIETQLTELKRTGERVRQRVFDQPLDAILPLSDRQRDRRKIPADEFPWHRLFIVGYGAGRTPDGREEYETYRNVDAVYTLFQYDQPLQSPELAWRRLLATARSRKSPRAESNADRRIRELLREILVLKDDEDVRLESGGIRVTGRGTSIPLSAHADGYKATTNWVLDLISWRLLFNRGLDPKTMTGIVLIDEIEQHLHPRWQRYIIDRLHVQFPRVQFIATTHSPLCVAGAAELTDDECQLLSFSRTEKRIRSKRVELPRGYRADQILTAERYFDLDDTRDPTTSERLDRYRELFRKQTQSEPERREFLELRSFVKRTMPDIAQFEEERRVRDELRELLKQIKKTKRRTH